MINQLIALVILSITFCSFGQIDSKFVEHLSKENLKTEHWTYLNSFEGASDSTNYYISKYHLQYGQDSSFLSSLSKSGSLILSDSLAVDYANQHFLPKDNSHADQWFNSVLVKQSSLTGIPFIYYAAYNSNDVEINLISKNLRNDFLRLQRSDRKSPFLAATFSAIVPGSGKLYIGSTRSFLITFVSLSLLGLQTWESYSRLGIKHPLTIINGGLFSLYYVTNIFGSYRETKTKKNTRRKQFLLDASKQYHTTSTTRLY